MARVTVEDCVLRVPNRFDLVLLAAQRSREVSAGGALTIDRDNDKNPVVALREIADGTVTVDSLQAALIQNLQRHVEIDEPEEDEFDALSSEISSEINSLMVKPPKNDELQAEEEAEDDSLDNTEQDSE